MEANMKYMLLIYGDELALGETEREACYVESTQLAQEIELAIPRGLATGTPIVEWWDG